MGSLAGARTSNLLWQRGFRRGCAAGRSWQGLNSRCSYTSRPSHSPIRTESRTHNARSTAVCPQAAARKATSALYRVIDQGHGAVGCAEDTAKPGFRDGLYPGSWRTDFEDDVDDVDGCNVDAPIVTVRFCVKCKTAPSQYVHLAGDYPPLGWSFLSIMGIRMERVEETDLWYADIDLCPNKVIEYKYCVVEDRGWIAGKGAFYQDHKALVAWQHGDNMHLEIPSWQEVREVGTLSSKEDDPSEGHVTLFARCDLFTAESE